MHTISWSRDFGIGLAETDGAWGIPHHVFLGDGEGTLIRWIVTLVGEGCRRTSPDIG